MTPETIAQIRSALRAYRSQLVIEGNDLTARCIDPLLAALPPDPGGALPEPWPGLHVEYDEGIEGENRWRRATIWSVRPDANPKTFYCEGSVSVPWTTEHIREVRSPDGRVVWRKS
jgi:hypothetical protein